MLDFHNWRHPPSVEVDSRTFTKNKPFFQIHDAVRMPVHDVTKRLALQVRQCLRRNKTYV